MGTKDNYAKYYKKAEKLYNSLENKAKLNPNSFKENYGQKEVRTFEDELAKVDLTYTERVKIMDILNAVMNITPY